MKALKGIVIENNLIKTETGDLLEYENTELEIGDHVTVCVSYISRRVLSVDIKTTEEEEN